MIPEKTIEELITRHSSLEKDLASGKVDKKLFAEKSKEYSDLNEILNSAKQYLSFDKTEQDLKKILDCLENDTNEIILDNKTIEAARKSVIRMTEIGR